MLEQDIGLADCLQTASIFTVGIIVGEAKLMSGKSAEISDLEKIEHFFHRTAINRRYDK